MALNRRDFLRYGGAGVALGAAAPLLNNPFFTRPLQAAMMSDANDSKMLLIFLRGGCDSMNMVIPQGDSAYNDVNRPTLFVDPDDSHEVTDYCHLHPSFNKVADEVPSGDVAVIHQVAYAGQSRSHFDSQQYWENAYPLNGSSTGWVNTLVNNMTFGEEINPIPAASVGSNLQVLFQGPDPLPHITNLANYSLENIGLSDKLLGALPGEGGLGDDGAGLLGIYSREPDDENFDALTRGNGLALSTSLAALADLDPNNYVPEGDATYPEAGATEGFPPSALTFFSELKQSVMLLKQTECRVAGIQLGGFDTHTGQSGPFSALMRVIDHAIWAVREDTNPSGVWGDLTVVVMSEFGRTSLENGSSGTDHGEGGAMIIAGGAVAGGAYNCDAASWGSTAMFGAGGRYVARKTDYRTILAELIDTHFGQDDLLDDVIQGWSGLSGDDFDYVGFIE